MATHGEQRESSPSDVADGQEFGYEDIGVNLTDSTFSGVYHGKKAHEPDLEDVIERAVEAGCRALVITGSDLEESRKAVGLTTKYPHICRATVGVHPCSSRIFETHSSGTEGVLSELTSLIHSASQSFPNPSIITDNKSQNHLPPSALAAVGEIGLDYDRLPLSPKATQLHAFRAQLHHITHILYPSPSSSPSRFSRSSPSPNQSGPAPPLFLHSRSAHTDFISLLREYSPHLPNKGVVHSFTGTEAEMNEILDLGYDIGINGCSVRSEEGLAVVRSLALGRIHLETDAPWCEIRQSSAGAQLLFAKESGTNGISGGVGEQQRKGGIKGGQKELARGRKSVKKEKWEKGTLIKGRNEPCRIGEVAEIVAAVKRVEVEVVKRLAWENWKRMFGGGVKRVW